MVVERLLGGATGGVLLMHQFRYDVCDSAASFAEGIAGRELRRLPCRQELVEAALNAACVTQQRGCPLGGGP
jgi:hypothetical protein